MLGVMALQYVWTGRPGPTVTILMLMSVPPLAVPFGLVTDEGRLETFGHKKQST